ncbi:hypothetical protein [Cryobacterium soli]|uniref:hypothetical protein n=1 Tax=Cryobacterium soli TaxID=2220095 RepID=UPI000E738044|nr:hypothetical protein [Cryobacterium soli]
MTARDDVNARRVERLTAQLATERASLARLTASVEATAARKAAAHWTETDSATGSGIRRKPNAKADAQRYAGYDREALVSIAHADAVKEVARLESALKAATAERFRVLFVREDLIGVRAIRDEFGWHAVVKVNAKSVSIKTGYSWNDLIPFDRVLEARA